MSKKGILPVLIVPTVLLLIPLAGNTFIEGWDWNPGSFVFAWLMMAGVCFVYLFVTQRAGSIAYRIATGIALLAGFMIVWGNLAVGFIGSEDNPANLMYGGVLAVAAVGAALARFEALGMARAMFAAAAAQFLVPVIALLVWPSDFNPGVLPVIGLNLLFVGMFAGSGLLFWRAVRSRGERGAVTVA
jgi:hypothetical protein